MSTTSSPSPLRIAIVGGGNMGCNHARSLAQLHEEGVAELAAFCEADADRRSVLADEWQVPTYASIDDLIAAKVCEAIIIVTPHLVHADLAIAAFRAGLHVLCEKPLAVSKSDCERMYAAHADTGLVFAEMLQQRTVPVHKKIRQLVTSGELGDLRRVSWTITNWFRSQAYYDSGAWRATWAGEGGGVLVNQVPHNLDLLWWLIDRMPTSVRATCEIGKYHDIEVEDEVTAFLRFGPDCSGTFITSTGESPGSNRLELVGERGLLVFENQTLSFTRNEIGMTEFSHSTDLRMSKVPAWDCTIPIDTRGEQGHIAIIRNFVAAIVDGAELLSPASDGIKGVEIANAMLVSSLLDRTIELPMDAALFDTELAKLQAASRFQAVGV